VHVLKGIAFFPVIPFSVDSSSDTPNLSTLATSDVPARIVTVEREAIIAKGATIR
jgi:hypothetical protein